MPSRPLRIAALLPVLVLAGCDDGGRGVLTSRLRALLEEAGRAARLPHRRVTQALLQQVHPVQLHRSLRWLGETMGELEGVAPGGFTREERPLGERVAVGGAGAFRFSRGTLALNVLFVEDALAHLEVVDPLRREQLAAHLATAPADAPTRQLFDDVGRDFWARALMGAEDKAFAMLHPGLQQALPGPEALVPDAADVPRGEALEEVVRVGYLQDPTHAGKLHLLYQVRGGGRAVPAHVTLQFAGLRVFLVGFQLPSQLPGPEEVTP